MRRGRWWSRPARGAPLPVPAGPVARRPPGTPGAPSRGAPAPAVIRARTWPTVTVSPASARISVIVPVAGDGTSASTLSVEISTIVSSTAIASPGPLAHSRIVPSVTDSPIWGMTISRTSPAASSVSGASCTAAEPPLSEPLACSALAPLLGAISASTWPTVTVSPSATCSFTSVPAPGEGTSASILSVEISTRGSSAAISSPSCLNQERTVPSVTDSPIWGMTT